MTKKSREKIEYLENEKSIWGGIILKTFFIIFKGLSIAKNCLRPERASLTWFDKKVQIKNTKMETFSILLTNTNLTILRWQLLTTAVQIWKKNYYSIKSKYLENKKT